MSGDITLVIPAWRRPAYLAAALASWQRARGIPGLHRAAIALGDHPDTRTEMTAVIADAGLPLEIWPDSPEAGQVYGPHRAIGEAVDTAFADPGCGFVIVSDEDCVVSDDILEYVAFARSQDTAAVSCHNDLGQAWCPVWDDTDAAQDAVRIRAEFTGWTWGVPRAAWDQVFRPEWDWDASKQGFDWQCHRLANRGLRVAIPDASRAQTIGEQDGVYLPPHLFASTQAASFREHRDPAPYRLCAEDPAPF